jgi:ABC-type methionine transport system ATPase subunit
MAISKRIVLHFPRRMVDRPIVSKLVKDFNLDFNILKASVTPDEEGLLVMELTGKRAVSVTLAKQECTFRTWARMSPVTK